MATEAQRKANRKFKEKNKGKIKRVSLDFYPSEADLIAQVEKQPNKQGYIKGLIRADMERKANCEMCRDIQHIHIYDDRLDCFISDMMNVCPHCGAKMDGKENRNMTANEFHNQKIIPLRMELQKLETEYRNLYRKECGEKIGEQASCKNCALSCVISSNDHNGCMGGKCTCCNDWCYRWIPENDVSKFLRKNYHYDSDLFYRLDDIFGSDFLKDCDTPEKASIVMEMLKLIARFDGKDDT